MGLGLLSIGAARDLGYIDTQDMAMRVERALTTLERLERHKGHLLNWYDTRSLEPLLPRYVSTVDSGNLAGALMALAAALGEAEGESRDEARVHGLTDTLSCAEEALATMGRIHRERFASTTTVRDLLREIRQALDSPTTARRKALLGEAAATLK